VKLTRITALPDLPERAPDSHKADYGRILIIAGSPGMTGAAYLAGKAALRSGSGLVTVACPRSLNPILEAKLTCVMTLPVAETADGTLSPQGLEVLLERAQTCDAVALGPGISRNAETRDLVRAFVAGTGTPLVVDADGLNNLIGAVDALAKREAPTVITPHPGEMARLAGLKTSEVQANREHVAADFAGKHGVIVLLKGSGTVVTDGQRIYVNETGNPGMASGGTGDVLTGIVASLLGRGIGDFESAQLGAYVHGLAGDIAASEMGMESLIATDLLSALPYALMRIPGHEPREWPGFLVDR
jgi:hydroxyethylthiazole kinase-like uncharacterized protein yjeF